MGKFHKSKWLFVIVGFHHGFFLGGMFKHQDSGCGSQNHCSGPERTMCREVWCAGAWLLLSECVSGRALPTPDSRGVTTRYQIQPAPQWVTQRILLCVQARTLARTGTWQRKTGYSWTNTWPGREFDLKELQKAKKPYGLVLYTICELILRKMKQPCNNNTITRLTEWQ